VYILMKPELRSVPHESTCKLRRLVFNVVAMLSSPLRCHCSCCGPCQCSDSQLTISNDRQSLISTTSSIEQFETIRDSCNSTHDAVLCITRNQPIKVPEVLRDREPQHSTRPESSPVAMIGNVNKHYHISERIVADEDVTR